MCDQYTYVRIFGSDIHIVEDLNNETNGDFGSLIYMNMRLFHFVFQKLCPPIQKELCGK